MFNPHCCSAPTVTFSEMSLTLTTTTTWVCMTANQLMCLASCISSDDADTRRKMKVKPNDSFQIPLCDLQVSCFREQGNKTSRT